MSRKVYTGSGDAWVRAWDTPRIEVYDADGNGPIGVVTPASPGFAAYKADEVTMLAFAASREVAVEAIVRDDVQA